MNGPTDLEFLLRVAVAPGVGALFGLERRYPLHRRAAPQALVTAGTAAFVLVGEQTATATAPKQITAHLGSRAGFLGGGVILREGLSVQASTRLRR